MLEHVFRHILLSLFSGFIAWKIFGRGKKDTLYLSSIVAFLTGFFVDLDHLIDYFFAFGFQFSLHDFITGKHFLVSEKNYVFLHGYEYTILSFLGALLVKNQGWKMILFAGGLSLFFHLFSDNLLLFIPFREYFILYRLSKGFAQEEGGADLF